VTRKKRENAWKRHISALLHRRPEARVRVAADERPEAGRRVRIDELLALANSDEAVERAAMALRGFESLDQWRADGSFTDQDIALEIGLMRAALRTALVGDGDTDWEAE
jgi:hypothetical protein